MNIEAGDRGGARRPVLLFCVFLASCLIVRLVALDADPPAWLSWSTGLSTDEGFYTLDARHEALFGAWAPGNFHDRLLSPLLSLLQQAVFTLFGPHLRVARLLSVTFGLLTVLVFWLGLRRTSGAQVAGWGAFFLGLAPPFALYNRLALQETPTAFWLAVSFTLWAYGCSTERDKTRTALFALAGAALGVAVVFKALALFVLPAFVWAWWKMVPGRQAERVGLFGLAGVLALYALTWYAPHHADLARMATYYRVHQMQPHSWASAWLNVRRGLIGGERGVLPYLLALLPVPVVLAGWGITRKADNATTLLALWLLTGLGICLLSSYAPSRYYVLFLPPLAGLAAQGGTHVRQPGQAVVIGLFLLTSGFWYAQAWTDRSHSRVDAAQELARAVPPGSTMIGEFAPALCLDTNIAAAPVQPGLSNDGHPIERLLAGYVAVTRAPIWEQWWRSRYPGIVQPTHRITTFTVGGPRHYVVDVYRVTPGQQ